MKNLAEAIKLYQEKNFSDKQAIANLNSALIRYTFPGLGFTLSKRSSKRLHSDDIKEALIFAESISLDTSLINQLKEIQEKSLHQQLLTLTNKRQQRKNLNKFLEFLSNYKSQEQRKVDKRELKVTKQLVTDRSFVEKNKTRKKGKSSIKLQLDFNKHSGDPDFNKKHLTRIEKELKNFENFLTSVQNSKYSIISTIDNVLILLGWQYLQNKSLDKVALFELVKVFNLNPDINEFKALDKYFIEKGRINQEAKKEAQKTIDFLENFFTGYKINNKYTKTHYITCIKNVSKFLYKDITDANEYENYSDIPVIRRLRIYNNSLKDNDKRLRPQLVSWDIIIKCLQELKRQTNLTHYEYIDKEGYLNKAKLTESTKSNRLQKFLILAFFTLVPPSRARVVRELRIGETLKHGLFKDNIFVPKNQLLDDEVAKYYIHLQPEDYKTGKTYGEWLAEFPNVQFNDGSNFYDYLDNWIYEGKRNVLLKDKSHNYLFLQSRASKPIHQAGMSSLISHIFLSTIGEAVRPHKLRTIYRTYLVNKGASQQELESAAFWMRHSSEIAKKIYTQQTLEEKLAPGRAISEKLNSEILNSY